jgi:hypothetical protein
MECEYCRHCALLIRPGDARWTAREPIEHWHYACAEEAGLVRSVPFVIPKVRNDATYLAQARHGIRRG